MSITLRPYRRGGWEADITLRLPNGRNIVSGSERPTSRSRRLNDGHRIVSGTCCNTAHPSPRRRCLRSKHSRRDSLTGTREHRVGPIDANNRHACTRKRNRNTSGAATELEHRPVRLERKRSPERNIAPSERACVLPVVERRIVVPAFIAFSHISRQWTVGSGREGSIGHCQFAGNDRTGARKHTEA